MKGDGADTVAAFHDGTAGPVSATTLVDGDFGEGDTATATFPKSGKTFFKAAIE